MSQDQARIEREGLLIYRCCFLYFLLLPPDLIRRPGAQTDYEDLTTEPLDIPLPLRTNAE